MDNELLKKVVKFTRELPIPFDNINLEKPTRYSKYGIPPTNGIPGRLAISSSVASFIMMMIGTENNKNAIFSVGKCIEGYAAEYNNPEDPEHVQLAIYHAEDGSISAARYNKNTRVILEYIINFNRKGVEDGILILAALWGEILADEEFAENYAMLRVYEKTNFVDFDVLQESYEILSLLSDSIYRRLKNSIIKFNDDVNIDHNIITMENIESPSCVINYPDAGIPTVLKPEFTYELNAIETEKISHKDFVGKYKQNSNKELSLEEKRRMEMRHCRLKPTDIINAYAKEICEDIVLTKDTNFPMKVFTLYGESGSGKTTIAKQIAAGLEKPFVVFSCGPNTDEYSVYGQIMPPIQMDENKASDAFKKYMDHNGKISIEKIIQYCDLTPYSDVLNFPTISYKVMTGNECLPDGKKPELIDAIKIWNEIMFQKVNEVIDMLTKEQTNQFVFVISDFMRAVKNGWTIEIQEPTAITNPAALVILNSLLAEGIITLPSGEVVEMHPETIIIFTTNVEYAGLNELNQSLMDRSNEMFPIDLPPIEVMIARTIAETQNTNTKMIYNMAKIIIEISEDMRSKGIRDGVCGMRSLINWANKSKYKDPYEAAMSTVINKVSLYKDNRDEMFQILQNSDFYKKRKKNK